MYDVKTLLRGMFALALLLPLAGCGYEQSGNYDSPPKNGYQWHSLYREDIQSVAVPIVTTKSFSRNVEFRLTKAVINQLESRSPYKVVPRERADTILEAQLTGVDIETLSRGFDNNIPQEQLMILSVNFTWKDLRTGQILLERKNFQQTATYYPTLGEDEFVGQQQAVERLALAMVQEMQADW